VGDWLRADWDFDDLEGSERRFRARLAQETDDAARAEILSQLARVEGLRGSFEQGERLLADAGELAGDAARARIRIDLERGRLRRSDGDPEAALPLFESAFARASEAGAHFLAVDAAHMAALAAPDRAGFIGWTERGIQVAETQASARYWLGPLLNNLGWQHFEAEELTAALVAFERALDERERDPANTDAIALARYAVAKTLRALGRPAEGVGLAEAAAASTDADGRPDGWYHEELAEIYAALGRLDEAATQAERALALLPEADSSFEPDSERAQRLRDLAASGDRARRT
jgi:tetratricopeptide (TPR) repeat protein